MTNGDVRVDRTEVALDTADFLFEDLVPEPRLEFTLSQGRRCHAHRVLSTTQQDLQIISVSYILR